MQVKDHSILISTNTSHKSETYF